MQIVVEITMSKELDPEDNRNIESIRREERIKISNTLTPLLPEGWNIAIVQTRISK